MIGVILWSEQSLGKAVIWCDDQGELAFYSGADGAALTELNPGDWVEFDITLSGKFRIAENLRILMEQGSPDLADRLSAAADSDMSMPAKQSASDAATGAVDGQLGKVVPFPQQAAGGRGRESILAQKQQG